MFTNKKCKKSGKENKLSTQLHQKSELNNLIDFTAEYIEKHNAVVTRLWEIQHQIEKHRIELLNNPDYLTNHEFNSELKSLKEQAKIFLNNLAENRSAEIIDANLKKIEKLYNELYPQNNIHFSSPIDLKKLKIP